MDDGGRNPLFGFSSVRLALVALTAVLGLQALGTVASAAGPPWIEQHPPAGALQYDAVSCATTAACEAGGASILSGTTKAGAVWLHQPLPPNPASQDTVVNAISCASTTTCEAVGASNASGASVVILSTTSGGARWVTQPTSGLAGLLAGVSCPSTSNCVSVGETHHGRGIVLVTHNGGTSWSAQPIPSGVGLLKAVACPSPSECIAVGFAGSPPTYLGTILKTTNGGTSWQAEVHASGPALTGVSCPTTSRCLALGDSPGHPGAILLTVNGGSSWRSSPFPQPSSDLYSVSCGSSKHCVAVGVDGTYPSFRGVVDETTNGGSSWNPGSRPRRVSTLNGVSCLRTTCVAVGFAGTPGIRSRGVILRQG